MKKPLLEVVRQLLITMFGCAVTAFAVATLLTPNKIVLGGATGIATILYHSLRLPQGLSFALFNAILLLSCFPILGKKFILHTVLGSGFLSLFVQAFSYLPP